MMSFLTYIAGFFMNFEFLPILTDYANWKKGGMKLKKNLLLWNYQANLNQICWNDPWVVPFQNCVRQRRPVSKKAAITKNRNFFKWPKLLYFNAESAQIWAV